MTRELLVDALLPVAHRIGLTLVHSTWQAASLALFLFLLLQLTRRASAQFRYLASCLTLLAIIATTAVTFTLTPAPARPSSVEPLPVSTPIPVIMTLPPTTLPPTSHKPPATSPFPLTHYLPHVAALWSLGVLTLACYHLGGYLTLRNLTRTATATSRFYDRLTPLAARLRVTRPVRLAESAAASVPAVVGVLRPVILLPLSLAADLSPAQLDAILAHELAHVRRHDYLANLLQTAIETLLFYHPAVWYVSAKIRQEREHCCDDLALAAIEVRRAATPSLAPSAGGGHLLSRIRRILHVSPPPARRTPATAALLAAGCLLLLPLTHRPTNAQPAAAPPPASRPSASPEPTDADIARAARRDPQVADLRQQRTQLELQLADLSQQVGAQNPKVAILKSQIDLIQTHLARAVAALPADSADAPASPVRPDDFLPETKDYRIAPGDLLSLNIPDLAAGGKDSVLSRRVTQSGKIGLPYVGEIAVADHTDAEAQKLIAKAFEDAHVMRNPVVSVTVSEARGSTYTVLGPGTPHAGQYPIYRPDLRLAEALAASGITSRSTTINLLRGRGPDQRRIEVSVADVLAARQSANLVIRPGDILLVSEPRQSVMSVLVSADTITVNGAPVRPEDLADAIRQIPASQRPTTLLTIGVTSAEVTFGRFMQVFSVCSNTAQSLDMPPVSNIGVQKPTTQPSTRNKQRATSF